MIRVSFWTCVFIVLLRIAIGWHFCYEGVSKVKSTYQGKASPDKVFSSETYFRESEGPFGRLVKSRLTDPDQLVVDQLTLKPVDGDASDTSPKSRFPDALAREWDEYFNRFAAQFRLDEEQKTKAQSTFDQAKAKYVNWVQGNSDETDKDTGKPKRILLKVKRKAPGLNNASADYDQEVTVGERAAELKKKAAEVRAGYKKMAEMGKDVDAVALRSLKTDVATIRTELRKDIDDQTKTMKDELAKLLDVRVTAFAKQADSKEEAVTLEAMLTPMADGNNPLAKMWDAYAEYVKDFSTGINEEQKIAVDGELRVAKMRFDRWLADRDMFTDKPLSEKEVAQWRAFYAAAKDPEELKTLTAKMQADFKAHSDSMRALVGAPLLGEDKAKGYAEPNKERWLWIFPKYWTLIDYFDWSTRWFLLVVGALLMVGLFTRLSCFSAAGFLFLTILTQLSVPWLPAAPNNEGSYLFVNKNVIEMIALLALMTTRSGQWFGLDALVSWVCGCRRRA